MCDWLTLKAKINIFCKIISLQIPLGNLHSKKFKKTLILAFGANSALVAMLYFDTMPVKCEIQ